MRAAIVLAAGASQRMGFPKALLPWADTTLLGHALRRLGEAGAEHIVVVLGLAHERIAEFLAGGLRSGVDVRHDGDRRLGERRVGEEGRHALARGRHERAVEGGGDGERDRALRAPGGQASDARATAAAFPAITVCSGEL